MSDQISQGKKEFSYAELCERARLKAAELENSDQTKADKKGKGLEFMAYKLSVARKHIELAVTKKVTPVESNLLRLLEIGTIGAQNGRSHITDKAEFYISDLSKALGYKEKAKIWRVLKSLEKKGYIIREKTRHNDKEILGLNPLVFDQILIDKQHEIARKRHLTLVRNEPESDVDNLDSAVDKSANDSCG
jgi:DNA-binding MarR family transcriptional regulator